MKKKNQTKRALTASALVLALCISMFIGTTFAWFTDSVQSGANRIIAGKLDVELTHQNPAMAVAESVAGSTELFQTALGSAMLWEPGAVAYEQFTVLNAGTLALKYQMKFSNFANNFVVDADGNLTNRSLFDVIRVHIDESGALPTDRPDFSASDPTLAEYRTSGVATGTLTPGESKVSTVILYWPSDTEGTGVTDNDYNLKNGAKASDATAPDVGRLTVDFKLDLIATQLQYESDSFGTDYDANADGTAAWNNVPVASVAASPAITAAPAADIEIAKSGAIESATVPATAASDIFTDLQDTSAASNELTLNLNVEKTAETAGSVDLEIDMTAVMKSDATTKTQNITALSDFVTINYNLGADLLNVAVTHSGNLMEALANAAATPANPNGGYYYNNATGILTIKTKSFSPFVVSFETPGWTGAVNTDWFDANQDNFEIDSADQLAGFAKLVNEGNTFLGKTVTLTSDIDLNNVLWTPIGTPGPAGSTDFTTSFKGVFDGQNHTISNLNVQNEGWAGLFGLVYKTSPFPDNPAAIQNVNVANATINSSRMTGTIVGQIYGSLENCHVSDATITVVPNMEGSGYDNGDKVGGIVGWLGDGNNHRVVNNCSATNVTLKAYRDVGGIAGYIGETTAFTGCSVSNITITVDKITNGYGNASENAGFAYGRAQDASSNTIECTESGTNNIAVQK